jgi:hypothetical protein
MIHMKVLVLRARVQLCAVSLSIRTDVKFCTRAMCMCKKKCLIRTGIRYQR